MHVSGFTVDLNWFLQFIVTAFIVAVGLLYLVKNTASKYFAVDANFDSSEHPAAVAAAALMPGVIAPADTCVVCGNETSKHCSGCKIVRYCSEACQRSHWFSGHNAKCKRKVNLQQNRGQNAVVLIAARGPSKILNQPEKILFPYDEFLELFNWEKPGFPPCGLLNCGNSCFANVVLQCLAYTRPLVAYLLKKGHQRECRRDDWCFLCELQNHVARASQSRHAFSPINILSRLPNIGGNLGYGKQEDAHEFMRFAIDTMQSISLDEFGGEKAVHPSAQETTLIQHIFGGQLQSQVICTKCNNVSDQFENMMDLTVEIHGDASSLEECLDQFTDKECLHGDNKYKCDGCNDYVLAWKRLTIRRAPNILTVALKRFQTGRFGKLNKRVTFPETLDLSPYMSGAGDGNDDVYKLYAVVVHVDMLNASFFGHYICYTKDFSGNWYRIDDCKVFPVELDEVLSQGAYMLLYSRVCARQSCLNFTQEPSRKGQKLLEVSQEVLPIKQPANCSSAAEESIEPATSVSGSLLSKFSRQETDFRSEDQMSSVSVDVREQDIVNLDASTSVSMDIKAAHGDGRFDTGEATSSVEYASSKLVTGANPVNFNVFHVENGNRAEENVLEGISVNSSTETDNHVREKLENRVGGADGANSSGPKLKPIFAPGFLGKRPRDRYAKSDVKAQSEVGELDMDASTSVSMDTDAYGDGTGEPTSSVEYACNKLVTGADPVNLTVCQAENGNGAEENGVSEGISVNSLIEIVNHVREKEKNYVAGVNSSGPKWKPIFAPGFLGKCPLNKYAKSDVKAQSEVGEVDMDASTSVSMDKDAHGDGSFDTGANPVNFNISHAENGNEAEENGVVAEGVSVNSLTETDNCIREKVRNSTSKAENHVGRVDVVSSGSKLKPIFAPGFLGKRQRDRYAKSDMKAQAKVDLLSHQNGQRLIKHEGKPNLKYIISTSMPMGTEESGSMTDMVATLGIASALDGESDKQIG